jgi:hypothetical protein
MAITRVGVSSSVIVSAGDVSVSEPASCQAGDLLTVPISYRDTPAFTIPSGWTLIVQLPNGNTVANSGTSRSSLALAYKLRGASAETGIVFARTLGNAAIGAMVAYRGVDQTTPFDQYVALDGVKTATPTTATGVTPAQSGALLLMLCAMANNTTASGETAAIDPTAANWTEFFDVGTLAAADVALALADAIQVTATATGVFSYTAGTNYVHAIAVAVFNPASTSGALLAGDAADVASATGDLSTGIPLAGSANDNATGSGSLSTGIHLAGAAMEAATGAGALTTGIPLAGGATDTATATASLTAPSQGLSGSAVDVASAFGALTTGIALAGAASDQASGHGALTTKIAISGAASDIATASGTLGNAGGTVTASDAMTRKPVKRNRALTPGPRLRTPKPMKRNRTLTPGPRLRTLKPQARSRNI